MTKPVTRKMVVDWFLDYAYHPYHCSLCSLALQAGQDIQWDHIHADVFNGPHEYQNLRPVHAECHKKKTARDIKDNAKIKRIRGETKTKKGKPIPSRPFPKPPKGYSAWKRPK